jgi:hypothetical protein
MLTLFSALRAFEDTNGNRRLTLEHWNEIRENYKYGPEKGGIHYPCNS